MFKKTKRAISIALALVMSVALSATVLAYTPTPGTPTNPRPAGITKELRTPVGTAIPANMAFNFTVTPYLLNGFAPGAPELGTLTIPALGNYPAAGSNHVRIPVPQAVTSTAGGIDTRVFDSGNLLAGITWPTTGVFEWNIVELNNVLPHTPVQNNPGLWEVLNFSQAEYTLRVHIGEYDGNRYVRFAYAVRRVNDAGTAEVPPVKVDPTPGADLRFINTYARDWRDNVDPEEGPLTIRKNVTGNMGSLTREFEFSATLTLDPMFSIPGPFVANRVDAAGNTIGTPISFTNGTSTNFLLRHNERLVFESAPVGTQFVVNETQVPLYLTTIYLNTNVPFEGLTVTSNIREAGDLVVYRNHNDTPPPTGIDMSNLPFYGMILLVLGGIVTFIIVKVKKRKSYNY